MYVIKMSTDKKNQKAFNLTNISPPPAHTIVFKTLTGHMSYYEYKVDSKAYFRHLHI